MKKKRIIEVLIDQPLNPIIKDKLKIENIYKKHDLRILSLEFYNKKSFLDFKDLSSDEFSTFHFKSFKEFRIFLKENTSNLIICFGSFDQKILSIVDKKRNLKLFYFGGYLPTIEKNNSLNTFLIKMRSLYNPSNWNKIFRFISQRFIRGHKNFSYIVLSGGSDGIRQVKAKKLIGKDTKIITINSFDLQRYQKFKSKKLKALLSHDYAVFLDQYIPYHPDFALSGIKIDDPEKYFKLINNFFDRFEKFHNIPIEIALHPKSKYISNPFNGRRIHSKETLNLILNSKIVIGHSSSALSFAALENKPIILIGTDTMIKNDFYIKTFQTNLDCSLIDLSKKYDLPKKYPLNKRSYDNFINRYLGNREIHDNDWHKEVDLL